MVLPCGHGIQMVRFGSKCLFLLSISLTREEFCHILLKIPRAATLLGGNELFIAGDAGEKQGCHLLPRNLWKEGDKNKN